MPSRQPSAEPLSATHTLLANVKAGDLAAREALYCRFHAPLSTWVRGRLPAYARGLTDTGDLVQDALMCSLSQLSDFKQTTDRGFLRYLQTSVMNGLRKEIRRHKRRGQHVEFPEELISDHRTPLDEVLEKEQLELYDQAVESLSNEEQDLVVARLELEMSFRDVAIHLGKPSADAARVAFHRALRKLADRMAAC